MNRYYQSELDNLRELAADFARAYPTLAPQLAAASNDPDVERLLQGVAFLTAGIRQKIDDDFPEFSQSLLKQIFPHYLRPLPSVSMVAFTPRSNLNGRVQLPAGTLLDSVENNAGVKCRFATCFDLDVWPLSLERAQLAESSTGSRYIELELRTQSLDIADWDSDCLRFYIGGDYAGASDLYYLLHNYLDGIELALGEAGWQPAAGLRLLAGGLERHQALLKYPDNAFPAYRLIQEYFLMKEKFLYIELQGLRAYTRSAGGNRLQLRLGLRDAPVRIPRIDASRFVLNVSPVINLFSMSAEAIRNDLKRTEYPVRPLRNHRGQYEVYSVDKVSARDRHSGENIDYVESGFAHPALNRSPVYSTFSRPSGDGEQSETFIRFNYPPDYEINPRETIMLELTCSNGRHPSQLKPGDINRFAPGGSSLLTPANLLPPTGIQYAGHGDDSLWRLISHLSLNYLSLADADNLKSLLGLYIFPSGSGNNQETVNRKIIEGITSLRVSNTDRLVRGLPMRGQSIELSLDSTHFAGPGDLYLFGQLLDYLFASFASINSFSELHILDSATGERFSWPARVGDKPLL